MNDIVGVIPRPSSVKILSPSTYCYKESDAVRHYDELIPREGYRLTVDGNGLNIYCSDDAGYFYALVTVRQLLAAGDLKHIEIKDAPRYAYRGFMLDCARHFFTVEEIKRHLDVMALFKLNVFHWHLTDDQGWRIQSERYPLLTDIGSYRSSTRGDGKPVKGFYTKEEMREIVEYAAARYIDVLPEFDIPGHASAAIAAYPALSCTGAEIAVKESFGIHEEVFCPGKEVTYRFLADVIGEIMDIFPFGYVHLGGDEALRLKWMDCEDCARVMRENSLKDYDELQAYFMDKIADVCRARGKTVINWNDGMRGANTASDIVMQYWSEGGDNKARLKKALGAGRKVIMSPFFSYYLDYPYGMTPLRKTFAFDPEAYDEGGKGGVIGVEAPLWTEYVDSSDRIDYQAYPRLFAVAERAWSPWHEDYKDFLARLKYIYNLIDKQGVKCAKIGEVDPSPLRALAEVIKFGINISDKTLREAGARVRLNKKRLKALERKKS